LYATYVLSLLEYFVDDILMKWCLLFTCYSGIPLQEKQSKARWGEDPEYQAYRARTFLLLPLPNPFHRKRNA